MSGVQASGISRSKSALKGISDEPASASAASSIRVKWTLLVIASLTLLLLITRINAPKILYWDERVYVGIARALLHGTLGPMPQQFSDASVGRQHPPMGPYLIAVGIKIAGDNPVGWRLPGVVCGTLTVIAIFLWTYVLTGDYGLAVTGACLTIFNNFLYVMSRIAMLDVFVFTFVIWAVLAFTIALTSEVNRGTRRILVVISGLFFGLGLACKWNAVDSLAAVAGIVCAIPLQRKYFPALSSKLETAAKNLEKIGVSYLLIGLGVAPILSYAIAFLPLLHAMQQPITLSGFVQMHETMLALTKAAPGNLAHYAPWYTWPLRFTPTRVLSYLLGNPVVMWGGLLSLGVCVYRTWKSISFPELLVISLYAANLLQWAFTPLRVPHYYYYHSAAMFLGTAWALALRRPTPQKLFRIRLRLIVVLAAFLVFLYCYPRMALLEAPWDCMFGCWV